jgi:hypothetical protein
MPVRAFFARLALALLLVFAQQQAVLHELQHSTDALSASKSAPGTAHQDVCLKCLGFAGTGNAPASSELHVLVAEFVHPHAGLPPVPQRSSLLARAYESRAPPLNA